jgi:glyoxylase-like metal-dependent hydrolase (beta-lactamase superfamily II)
MSLEVKHFFDKETYTLSYIVFNPKTKDSFIIDPVLNYNQASSKTSFESFNELKEFLEVKGLNVHYILETHAHADHLSAAQVLKEIYPSAKLGIGKEITKVQGSFSDIYNLKDVNTNGIQFDLLLEDNQILDVGSFELKVLFTPGHTPACCSYLIEDLLFTGDALFMPDYGTGRCDFPLGSSKELYNSIHNKLYKLPDATRFFTCHDYMPNGRDLMFESTIGESKKNNIQLKESTTQDQFTEFRDSRDATLSAPKLLLPSIQINIDAGKLPEKEDNGKSYLKIPIN